MNCKECNAKMVGRSDKKFCDDFCRNTFNNRQNRDYSNLMRTTHNTLRRNHRILMNTLLKVNNLSVSELAGLGFEFGYCTSMHKEKDGQPKHIVYDLVYEIGPFNQVFIRRNS